MKKKIIALAASALLVLQFTACSSAAYFPECASDNGPVSSVICGGSPSVNTEADFAAISENNASGKTSSDGLNFGYKLNVNSEAFVDMLSDFISGFLKKFADGSTRPPTGSQDTEKTSAPSETPEAATQGTYPAETAPATTRPAATRPATTKPAATTPSVSEPAKTTATTSAGSPDNLSFEQQVAELVNAERAKNGLAPLTLTAELSNIARIKSQDMHDNHYFSHTSPIFGSTFSLMNTYGIAYRAAGENIAMGYATPEAVMNGWMNSAGHRANILNSSFTQIGVGYVADGNYWTQVFIG